MTKTIIELWHGNLQPMENIGSNSSEIEDLQNLIQRNLDTLNETLSEEQKEMLKNYSGCMEEYISIIGEQAFSEGYCHAAKLTSEALLSGNQGEY